MTRAELESWALTHGWQRDHWGHLQRVIGVPPKAAATYRLKLSAIAVRYEVRSTSSWVRLRSNYLSKITVTPEGKLAGLTRGGCGA